MEFPLRPGITYIDNNGRDITLEVKNAETDGKFLYSNEVDLWFDSTDGHAPGTDVRIITQHVPDAIAALRTEREEMRQRLKEMGLC
jgi:hypothetical protein